MSRQAGRTVACTAAGGVRLEVGTLVAGQRLVHTHFRRLTRGAVLCQLLPLHLQPAATLVVDEPCAAIRSLSADAGRGERRLHARVGVAAGGRRRGSSGTHRWMRRRRLCTSTISFTVSVTPASTVVSNKNC